MLRISMRLGSAVLLSFFLSFTGCRSGLRQTYLFEDSFDTMQKGYISVDVGNLAPFQYIPEAGQKAGWTVTAFEPEPGYGSAWEIAKGENGHFLKQNYHNITESFDLEKRHTRPTIVAGDSLWQDYTIEVQFSPGALMDQCGVMFRYQNDRSYYFFGMEGNRLMLKLVDQVTAPYRPFERVLASRRFEWDAGLRYNAVISLREDRIYALLNDSINLLAKDNTYNQGKIGLTTDVPAEFYQVEVKTLNSEKRKLRRKRRKLANATAIRLEENPKAVLWKKVKTIGYVDGNHLRFGDLDGDGQKDVLACQAKNDNAEDKGCCELSCLTAMTFDGELLWQKGIPDSGISEKYPNLPVQIHDLDGDGKKEVIYMQRNSLVVAEGKTGKIIQSVSLPFTSRHTDKMDKKRGCYVYFCDLQGKERAGNLLLKDCNSVMWAYDAQLNLMWNQPVSKSNYAYAWDIDNDGKDEVATGYSLIDNDGTLLWDNHLTTGGQAYGLAAANLNHPADSSLKVIYAAGDWGMILKDTTGKLIKHNPVGHIQKISIANYRADMDGLEMISVNYWGNQGIVNFYDARGDIYHTFEPGPFGSLCFPVNWKGDGEEFFILNASPGDGGMLNGKGELAVALPDDGHPEMFNAALDVTGDVRDEVLVWDHNEIWVYTQDDSPRKGKLYEPVKNPLYNYSNYNLIVSRPGWNQ